MTITKEEREQLAVRAESFAKYHDEHAKHGRASHEFHAYALTFLRAEVPRVLDALAAAEERAEKAEASAAVMREALEHVRDHGQRADGVAAMVFAALATDAGKALLEEVKALRAAATKAVAYFDWSMGWTPEKREACDVLRAALSTGGKG